MTEPDEIDDLEVQLTSLEEAMGGARSVTAAFEAELGRMRGEIAGAGREVTALSRGLSRGLRRSFEDLVFDGASLSEALRCVAQSMADTAYRAAVKPVSRQLGGMLAEGVGALMPFADGAGFAQGRVRPFATGGVVSGPVAFPMRGGTGLMGEAGPEAILPLARGADGRLGVQAGGGRPVQVVVNVATRDADSFRRSHSQIAAQMGRALSRGQRNR